MAHGSMPLAELVLRLHVGLFPSPSMISVVLCWLMVSQDLSGSGHRFLSFLSPNRPTTCINQVEQSEGFTWRDGRSKMNSVGVLQEEGASAACLCE